MKPRSREAKFVSVLGRAAASWVLCLVRLASGNTKLEEKKSEPQIRTRLSQTCAKLGSDFFLFFLLLPSRHETQTEPDRSIGRRHCATERPPMLISSMSLLATNSDRYSIEGRRQTRWSRKQISHACANPTKIEVSFVRPWPFDFLHIHEPCHYYSSC